MAYPADVMSSKRMPRSAATWPALLSFLSASMVAWMTLVGFEVFFRMHLVRMSCIPATSSTGETGRPRDYAVPGLAGRKRTGCPGAKRPLTSWGMVGACQGNLEELFSLFGALRIVRNLLALPPAPTYPADRPTTTSQKTKTPAALDNLWRRG